MFVCREDGTAELRFWLQVKKRRKVQKSVCELIKKKSIFCAFFRKHNGDRQTVVKTVKVEVRKVKLEFKY